MVKVSIAKMQDCSIALHTEPCEYIAFAKTDQLKFKWRDSINKARYY